MNVSQKNEWKVSLKRILKNVVVFCLEVVFAFSLTVTRASDVDGDISLLSWILYAIGEPYQERWPRLSEVKWLFVAMCVHWSATELHPRQLALGSALGATTGLYRCRCVCAQLCPTVCHPMDCSPPGSSVHAISQARIVEYCHFLLQGIFPAQELNPCLLHWQTDFCHCAVWEAHRSLQSCIIL